MLGVVVPRAAPGPLGGFGVGFGVGVGFGSGFGSGSGYVSAVLVL